MKKVVTAMAALLALATATVLIWQRDQTSAPLSSSLADESSATSTIAPPDPSYPGHRLGSAAEGVSHQGAKAKHPFPAIALSRDRIPLEADPFSPTSKAEQRWLDRHGYPTQEQIDTYSIATEVALELAVAAGDRVAADFLESRRLAAGDTSAEKRMWEMAVNGQTYALTGLAGYYAQNGPKGNPMKAYAYSRVAEMRGDYKAALTRDFVVNRPLTPMQRTEAEAKALTIFRAMTELRRQRFGPNVPVTDPRPLDVD